MQFFIVLLVILISSSGHAQSNRNSARSNPGGTHLMGSGAKNVQGMGVSKDTTKYKQLEKRSRKQLQEEEVGNNPTSTDTIQGRNSRRTAD